MNKETFSNLKLLLCSGILILTLASLTGCAKKEQPTVTETDQPTAVAEAELPTVVADAKQAIAKAEAIADAEVELPTALADAKQAIAKAELPTALAEVEQAIAEAVEEHPTEEGEAEHPTAEAGEEHPTEEHPAEGAEHPTEEGEHPAEAAEHPEHPTEKAEHPEHPAEEGEHSDEEAEHPEHPAEESDQTQVQPQREVGLADISDGIKKHIVELSSQSTDGMFHADYDGVDLALTLVKVHDEKLAILGSGAYFACTDLKTTDGSIYDLDFFLTGEAGNMKVTETTVHKDNGKPLYGWKQRDDGVWIKNSLE